MSVTYTTSRRGCVMLDREGWVYTWPNDGRGFVQSSPYASKAEAQAALEANATTAGWKRATPWNGAYNYEDAIFHRT